MPASIRWTWWKRSSNRKESFLRGGQPGHQIFPPSKMRGESSSITWKSWDCTMSKILLPQSKNCGALWLLLNCAIDSSSRCPIELIASWKLGALESKVHPVNSSGRERRPARSKTWRTGNDHRICTFSHQFVQISPFRSPLRWEITAVSLSTWFLW